LKAPSKESLQEKYRQELKALHDFLGQTADIWCHEVLNTYPKSRSSYKESWLETVAKLSSEEKWHLDCGRHLEELPSGELKDTFREMEDLAHIPKWPGPQKTQYPSWALHKVSGKKQHEIERIVPLTPLLGLKDHDSHFVDIGGGKGHLSRILCLYHGLSGISLDTNEKFQNLGKERLKKYPHPEGAGQMHFIQHTFGTKDPEGQKRELSLFSKAKASLGLHTCGPLALHHLKQAKAEKGLLNFGCCYQKLEPKTETQLSQFTRERPLPLNKFALTLASRGATDISFQVYQLKEKVKLMRAALHFYLMENFNHQDFVTVGSALPKDYRQDFSHYAKIKCAQLGIHLSQAQQNSLNDFFKRDDIQEKIHHVYHANIVRWRWSRILEKYLIYDRALYLVEQGHTAEVYQFFDANLSPRNIGILIRSQKVPG
jgi:hypothetical protein